MGNAPWHSRIALGLAAFLPVYFAVAALGTRFGLWDWKTGLITLTITAGPVLLAAAGLIALVSLIAVLWRKPRTGWPVAAIALLVPVAIFATLGVIRSQASAIPPIHDIATDLSDPPALSERVMSARTASGANPLNDYATPLGQLEPWKSAPAELKQRSHAEIIAASYGDLAPLPLGSATPAQGMTAVAAAMKEMGFADVTGDEAAGRAEGVSQSFWFGFKDDVVARVSTDRIDFRSVSRVGLSDLGANAARIRELREKVARRLVQ